jgi:tRNA(Ile)-lysidine synthase TilS/MesJ
MYPVQPVCRGTLTLIRPFVYVREAEIKRFAARSGLPLLPRLCPVDGKSRRQKVKDLIAGLQRTEKKADIRKNLFTSLYHVELRDFSGLLAPGTGASRSGGPPESGETGD